MHIVIPTRLSLSVSYRRHSHLSSQSGVAPMQMKSDKILARTHLPSTGSLSWNVSECVTCGRSRKSLAKVCVRITWCPEQIVPFGILALKGLCTGHDVRGPQREGPGNGTELKLFCCWLLQGLHNGGGGNWPCSDVIEGPCASTGRWGICICWWWHIEPAQLGIGHCPPLLIPPLLQYGSTVKLSWLLEHFSWWKFGGGDDCRE